MATASTPPHPAARRPVNGSTPSTFALVGRSVVLDPRIHAVRGDLADVRLAGQVFAPHYAEPMLCRVERPADLRDARAGGAVMVELVPGEPFEVLELAGDHAWGTAPSHGLVGYVDRDALARADA